MKAYWGSGGIAPGTHWIGGWVGPRAILDMVVEKKIPSPTVRNSVFTISVLNMFQEKAYVDLFYVTHHLFSMI
jgi:hypothetical protein